MAGCSLDVDAADDDDDDAIEVAVRALITLDQ